MFDNGFDDTVEKQLAEVITLNYVDEARTKEYLANHPKIFSLEARLLVKSLVEDADEIRNPNMLSRLRIFSSLMDVLWTVTVIAPISIGHKYTPSREVAEALHVFGVDSINTLQIRLKQRSDLWQELGYRAIKGLSLEDWAIIAFITATITESHDLLTVIEEFRTLINFESSRKMRILLDWAKENSQKLLFTSIKEGIEFIDWTRGQIDSDQLVLHDRKVWRMCSQYFYSNSWQDARRILDEFKDELFTDVGLKEMASFVDSAVLSKFIMEGEWEFVSYSMIRFDVFARCRLYGVDFVFEKQQIPALIPELWCVGGFLFSANPSIRTLDGFLKTRQEDHPDIDARLNWVNIVLDPEYKAPSNQEELNKFHGRLAYKEIVDKNVKHKYALIYFALKSEAFVLCNFMNTEPEMYDPEMISCLGNLINISDLRDSASLAAPLIGLKVWLESPYMKQIVMALYKLGEELVYHYAPNGSILSSIIGGLLILDGYSTKEEKVNQIENYPALFEQEAIELVSLLVPELRKVNVDLAQATEETLALLGVANEVGGFATKLSAFAEEVNLPDFYSAILMWFGASNDEQADSVVKKYPGLLTNEAISYIEELLNNPEVKTIFESMEIPDSINVFDLFGERYAQLLRTRRRSFEDIYHHLIPEDDASGAAADLILELEINIPAHIWSPVSRINLTNSFEALLNDWIRQLENHAGADGSKYLRTVLERTSRWGAKFGEIGSEHTQLLSDMTLKVYQYFDIDDPGKVLEFVEENKNVVCQSTLDILLDWIVVADDLGKEKIREKLKLIYSWIKSSTSTSPEIGLMDLLAGDERKEYLGEIASDIFGFENIHSYEDLWSKFLSISDSDMMATLQRIIDIAESSNDIEQIAQARKLRFDLLRMKIEQAANNRGSEGIVDLFLSEPMIFNPEMVEYLTAIGFSLPEFEKLGVMSHITADPLLRRLLLGEDLSSNEQEKLDMLDAEIATLYALDNWLLRLAFINRDRELLSDRAWAMIHIGYAKHLDTISSYFQDRQMVDERIKEVKAFIDFCRNTSFDHARKIKICDELGIDINHHWADDAVDFMDLLFSLPFSVSKKIEEAKDEVELAKYYEGLDKSQSLDTSLRGILYQQIGIAYGTSYEKNSDPLILQKAINSYRLSIDLTQGEGRQRATRLTWLGNSLRHRFDKFGQSKTDLYEAIECFKEASTQPGITKQQRGYCLGHLGAALLSSCEAFGKAEDLEEAVEILEKAIELTPSGTQDWVGWHINLGLAFSLYAKEHDDNRLALKRSQEIYQIGLNSIDEYSDTWWILKLNMLSILDELGNLDDVLDEYKAIDVNKISPTQLVGFYMNYGATLVRKYRRSGIQDYLDQAIDLYQTSLKAAVPGTPDWIKTANNLTSALRDRIDLNESSTDVDFLEELVESLVETQVLSTWPKIVLEVCEILGNYYGRRTEFAKAIRAYKKSVEALDIMWRSTYLIDERINFSRAYEPLFARLVYSCLQVNLVEEAFNYMNLAKARVFSDMLSAQESGILVQHEDPELITLLGEERNIQRRLKYLRGLLTGEEKNDLLIDGQSQKINYVEINDEIQRLESLHADILDTIRYEHPGANKLGLNETINVDNALRLARDLNSTLVDYHRDLGGWGAFVINSTGIKHIRLIKNDPQWDRWISNLVVVGSDRVGKTRSFDTTLRELYNVFIRPLASDFPPTGSRIVLSPSGLLSLFPLPAALDSQGAYLLDNYDICITPSLSTILQVREQSTSSVFENLLLVGYPGKENTEGYLKHIYSEINAISRIADNALTLENDDATQEGVMQKAHDFSVIHFACHGIINWPRPEESGLVLSKGDWLTIQKIASELSIPNTYLVVLAACEAGLEYYQEGDEHKSLVRAFLSAGASSVIASLWPVDDLSTELLMINFYKRHIKDGLHPSKALSEAQTILRNITYSDVANYLVNESSLNYIDKLFVFSNFILDHNPDDKPFVHPYHWAGFYYTGI
jgi:CHAT domain-containing protein/tetratricopeptide (TPR) repeat protein